MPLPPPPQAYLLWEQAGKPDGADFGDRARQVLEGRLRAGATLADIEREFRAPPPQQQQAAPAQQRQAAAPAAPAPPPPPPVQPVVGRSMGMRERNPLDLIRRGDGSGGLLREKPRYLRTPLTHLLEAAQVAKEEGRITWYRVRGRGRRACWPGGPGRRTLAWKAAGCCGGRVVPAEAERNRECRRPPTRAAGFRAALVSRPPLSSLTRPPSPPPACPPQLYQLGDARELLVTVAQADPLNPDSAMTVDLTTTLPERSALVGAAGLLGWCWAAVQGAAGPAGLLLLLLLAVETTTLPKACELVGAAGLLARAGVALPAAAAAGVPPPLLLVLL